MSSELSHRLQQSLERTLQSEDYELIGLVPIPRESDRRMRFETLHQLVEDFDSGLGEQWIGYVVQVKKKPAPAPGDRAAAPAGEPVYMPDGRMNAPYLLKNADLLLTHGDLALAKRIYLSLLAAGEMLGQAHHGHARCLEREGLLAEARDAYEKSIAYLPTLGAARDLARLYARRGQERDAAKTLERALQGRDLTLEERRQLHWEAGRFLSGLNDWAAARQHVASVLDLGGSSAGALSELGEIELRLGRLGEARRCFQDALSLEPEAPPGLRGLATCLAQEGDLRAAHDAYARSLEGDLSHAQALHELVRIAYELKTYSTAASLLAAYVQAHPVTPSLLYTLAGLDFHLGRLSEARDVCMKVLELEPGHLGAAELLRMVDRYSGSR